MSSYSDSRFDIVIVGAGMVGATMACLLRDTTLRIALVDQSSLETDLSNSPLNPDKFESRVSALTAASKSLFTQLGIWSQVESRRVCDYQDMHVWDADGTGKISFSAKELNQKELGSIVENSLLTDALYKQIKAQENLTLITSESIQELEHAERETILTMESGNYVSAQLVIAADGANSRIRELSEFKTKEWDYDHHALVTTVKTELPHQRTALQRFMETGPLAFLPLTSSPTNCDQKYCSIVWSAIPSLADELRAMTDSEFCKTLGFAIEHRLGNIEYCDNRFSFPLRQRHAIDYVKSNIVLIGDAAHSIHPLAGQGVNLGFLDASVLAQELIHGLNAGRTIADTVVLSRYQRKRIGHNLGMMWVMEGFKHLFAEQALPIRWLRNIGMSGVDNIGAVKNHLARRAMGLDWSNV